MPLTLPTTIATRALVPWGIDFEGGEIPPYPYPDFHGRADEQRRLREWLGATDRAVRPRGGAALVTGFRGVGKSLLVNKVLFDAGIQGLLGLAYAEPGTPASGCWGPFVRRDLEQVMHERRLTDQAVMFFPVRVEIADAIEPDKLFKRLLRRTYFAAAHNHLGALRPDLLRRLRFAYLRTLRGAEIEQSERFKSSFGIDFDNVGKLEVTAQQEWEFAETLKLVAGPLDIEEAEDEILEFGRGLGGARVGQSRGAKTRASTWYRRTLDEFQAAWAGTQGLRIHLVYVFDELDKLASDFDANARKDGHLTIATEVVNRLKSLFTTGEMSCVVIGGISLEEAWAREEIRHDSVLRSLFSPHVYVPQLDAADLFALGYDDEQRMRLAALATRGRYKHLIWYGAAEEGRIDARLAEVIGPWGPAPQHAIDPQQWMQAVETASDLTSLAEVLYATMPVHLDPVFRWDLARTVVAVEFQALRSDVSSLDREAVSRVVDSKPLSLVLERLRTVLVRAPGAPQARARIESQRHVAATPPERNLSRAPVPGPAAAPTPNGGTGDTSAIPSAPKPGERK